MDEEVGSLVGECVVGPLLDEDFLDKSLGLKRLEDLHDLEFRNIFQASVFGKIIILVDDNDTLVEQELVDLFLILF